MKALIAAVLLLVSAAVGQETQSLSSLRGQAEKGDTDAQCNLGFKYDKGRRLVQDYAAGRVSAHGA